MSNTIENMSELINKPSTAMNSRLTDSFILSLASAPSIKELKDSRNWPEVSHDSLIPLVNDILNTTIYVATFEDSKQRDSELYGAELSHYIEESIPFCLELFYRRLAELVSLGLHTLNMPDNEHLRAQIVLIHTFIEKKREDKRDIDSSPHSLTISTKGAIESIISDIEKHVRDKRRRDKRAAGERQLRELTELFNSGDLALNDFFDAVRNI